MQKAAEKNARKSGQIHMGREEVALRSCLTMSGASRYKSRYISKSRASTRYCRSTPSILLIVVTLPAGYGRETWRVQHRRKKTRLCAFILWARQCRTAHDTRVLKRAEIIPDIVASFSDNFLPPHIIASIDIIPWTKIRLGPLQNDRDGKYFPVRAEYYR